MNESLHVEIERLFDYFLEELALIGEEITEKVEKHEDHLELCDGKLKLFMEIPPLEKGMPIENKHVHVVSRIVSPVSVSLNACITGLSEGEIDPLHSVARNWVQFASPPIFSFIHSRELLGAEHFTGVEFWGVPRRHGYAGPLILRMIYSENVKDVNSLPCMQKIGQEPLFVNVPELVESKGVHFAKVVVSLVRGEWERAIEIDDHDIRMHQDRWNPENFDKNEKPDALLMVLKYALFFEADDNRTKTKKEITDEILVKLMENYSIEPKPEISIDALMQMGFEKKTSEQLLDFAPMAFVRELLKEQKITFPETYYMIREDKSCSEALRLDENFIYNRARILAPGFLYSPSTREALQYWAESSEEISVISNALNNGSEPQNLLLLPSILCEGEIDINEFKKIAERITELELKAAREKYNIPKSRQKKKKWWQFWK